MYYIGLDVASKSSFVYAVNSKGKKIESREIPTDKDSFRQYFRPWAKKSAAVAVESGGHSRWIHDVLSCLGLSVYVVNPNKVKLISESKRKTDKVDAKVLAELLRMDGLPQRVFVVEGKSRELRDLLRSRQQIIKGVTGLMNHLRGMLRQEGIKLPIKVFKGGDVFSRLRENNDVPAHFAPILASYEKMLASLQDQRQALSAVIADYRNKDIDLLKSVPGVGEIASKTIYAAVSTIKRFKRAKQLASYCGLVPSVRSSGDRAEYGHITREGRSEVRRVVVQCAQAIMRSKNAESKPLRRWHERVAKRRGFKTALVGLARKLMEIIFYVLRDRRPYDVRLVGVH